MPQTENPSQQTPAARPQPQPGISRISPYKQGKSQAPGHPNPIKLSSNESSMGPSPRALKAYKDNAASLFRYPDGSQQALREAIGRAYDLPSEQIICGNGSAELIDLLIRTYVGAGQSLLLSQHHFEMCPIFAHAQAAQVVIAPEQNYQTDVAALLNCVNAQTRMVILANPNNPAGTYINRDALRRLHAGLPADCLLVLDDAYAEYVIAADYDAGLHLVEEFDNVVVTRTFSKIYGLAALRIGWAYCPPVVCEQVQRIRTPFNANAAAMAAAAAAVADHNYLQQVRDHNHRWRERLTQALRQMGLTVIDSVTNFYLIDFTDHPSLSSADTAAFLEREGIIPRPVNAGGGADVLRITVGLDVENEAVIAAFEKLTSAS